MGEWLRLSADEERSAVEEERRRFAEKQKLLLETKSKINRGKLSNVTSITEKTLNVFLQSCCEETEKEQAYVSNVIERVRVAAEHTKTNLKKVNRHARELCKNVEGDVLELSNNLQRIKSGHIQLSSVLERRELRGRALRKRGENSSRSATYQLDSAKNLFCRIIGQIDSQIAQLNSDVVDCVEHASQLQSHLVELEKETDVKESELLKHQEEKRSVEEQIKKFHAEYELLRTQLNNRNKAKECAESDKARIEMEVLEFRDFTASLVESISLKVKSIEENEAQSTIVSGSFEELHARFLAVESDVVHFEQCFREDECAAKIASEDVVQKLEREVEEIENQLSHDSIRADVMDGAFGNDCNITPHEWQALVEKAKLINCSNAELSDCRNALVFELDTAKSELENVRHDAETGLSEQNASLARTQHIKQRIREDEQSREGNLKLMESRITQAMKELEELADARGSERNDEFRTPHTARNSSLPNVRKVSVEYAAVLTDDSDVESVKKSVVNLPEGIVKRAVATQQCSVVCSPDASMKDSVNCVAANNGRTSAVTTAMGGAEGDITMEGIPLTAPIDCTIDKIDKIDNWIRDTPDNNSPGSGTTAEMMDERFPKNIFNETNALSESDITMDMDDDDMNLSMMEMPPATATKTLSPPPLRQTSLKMSIIMNDSDSDANASVWGDDF